MAESEVRAWTYTHSGYPSTLKFSTAKFPASPSPHCLLIQTHAAALNPVDIQMMNVPIWSLPYLRFPKIPGADFAGTVIAAGPETTFHKGDEIFGFSMGKSTNGALSEVLHVDERNATIVMKPKDWSWVEAASLPLVWLTASTTIEKCRPFMSGAKKLVVLGGSSSVGIYAIWLAKLNGWHVLATCSGPKAEFVREMGADEVVDYTTDSVVEKVKAYKPDAVIDCVGGTDCIGIARRYVTIVGDKTSRSTMGGSVLYLFSPRMTLRWLFGYAGLGQSYECIMLDQRKEYLEEALKLPKEKIIIDSTFPFDRANEAYERLNTGRARGKVVVQIE